MDFKKAQEICQAQIDKAELAGDKERAEQLREELKTIQEADRLDRETDRVVMYELPRGGGDEAEEGDAQPTGEAPEETKE